MSEFTIYPAIDLRGGKCVNLLQGDYSEETVFSESPYQTASAFIRDGASWLHIVDLDGAREGKPVHFDTIKNLKNRLSVAIQVGGGIRRLEDAEQYFAAGIDRVIVGSAAIASPHFVDELLQKYPDRVVIGVDARDGFVAVEGWTKTSHIQAEELAGKLADKGARRLIYTDIGRDGMLSGVNVEGTVRLARRVNASVIASGGVRSIADVEALAAAREDGVAGVIIGKALYTGAVSLPEALKKVDSAC